jgi:predicted metal-dependent phosphoesterase TrpH
MRCDFHLHTRLSDGLPTPRELLAAVRKAGLDAFAVTDHDTLAGWRALAGEPGLVPGVEVTAGLAGREIHVVALGIDPEHQGFAAFLAGIRQLRVRRLTQLIARLGEEVRRGLTIDALASEGDARHADALGRLHLAKALVRRGGVATVADAFNHHLGDDYLVDAELEPYPQPTVAAEAIRAAGGVALLAHPGVYRTCAAVIPLLELGLDGLECNHPNLDPALAAELTAHAQARGLLISSGSDLHFLGGTRKPGEWNLDQAQAPLLERLGIRRSP